MRKFAQRRVTAGGYSSISEYIRDLVRIDQRQYAQAALENELLEALQSGAATVVEVPWPTLHRISERITAIPGVNRCLYDLTPKPPATIEYV